MLTKTYEYCGYIIELFEHPIYHDFEFVVKSKDAVKVIATSNHVYEHLDDAERDAILIINNI